MSLAVREEVEWAREWDEGICRRDEKSGREAGGGCRGWGVSERGEGGGMRGKRLVMRSEV